jgi:hypothetical protein
LTFRLALAAAAFLLTSCGYRVGTQPNLLPPTLKTIAVPVFSNLTNRYKLSERLPDAISREFASRTRYRIVSDPEEADAVLNGSVMNYMSFPHVNDPSSNRASAIQVSVYLQVSLTDRKSGTVLFTRPNMEFRQRYEISVDQSAYYEESDMALERLSRDVARTVVTSVLEAF